MSDTAPVTTTRGRPEKTAEQKEDIRRTIIDVAMRRFLESGHSGISMRAIARDMNSSTSKIYHYYESKIDILRDLSSIVFKDLFDEVDALEYKGSDPHQHLLKASECYVQYWLNNVAYYRMVFMVDGFANPQLTYFIDLSEIEPRYQVFARLIREMHGGAIAGEALQLKLDSLVCFLNGIAHSMISVSDHTWSDVSAIVAIAVNGIRAPMNGD